MRKCHNNNNNNNNVSKIGIGCNAMYMRVPSACAMLYTQGKLP